MAKDYRTYRPSRLQKIEDKKNTKQALFFIVLTIVLLIVMVFLGVPALTKLAIFLGDIRSTGKPINPTSEEVLIPSPKIFADYDATNSAKITIKGYGQPDTKVKLIVNGRTITDDTDVEGDFVFKNVDLDHGSNKINAVIIVDNNESKPSPTLEVNYDNEPPELIIDTPNDGNKYYDFEQEIEISGATEPDATAYINGRLAIVDTNGQFHQTFKLSQGDNLIVIKAVDVAGNHSEKQLTVSYER